MDKKVELFLKQMIKEIEKPSEDVSLKMLCEHYQEFVLRNRSTKTYIGVTLICDKFLSYFSPIRKISTIKLRDGERFIDWIRKSAPKGVYSYLRTIIRMFNKAIEWNYISENVFNKVKLPKRFVEKPAILTEILLWKIVEYIKIEVVRDIIIMAYFTGCRRGELTNLMWENVNLTEKILVIGNARHATKNRRQRVIPIHPRVEEILVKRLRRNKPPRPDKIGTPLLEKEGINKKGYVFCKRNGEPYTGDFVSKRFKKACRDAGISEEIHFHSIRHSSITQMILQGSPLPVVQNIAGHAQITTLMIYTHPDMESLREAVNRL